MTATLVVPTLRCGSAENRAVGGFRKASCESRDSNDIGVGSVSARGENGLIHGFAALVRGCGMASLPVAGLAGVDGSANDTGAPG